MLFLIAVIPVVSLSRPLDAIGDEYFPLGVSKWYYGMYLVCGNVGEAKKQLECDKFHIAMGTYNDPHRSVDCGIKAKCAFWLHCVKPERSADEVPIALSQQIVVDLDGPYNWSRWLKDKNRTHGSVVLEKARHYYGEVSTKGKTYDVVIRAFPTQFCDDVKCLPPEPNSACD